jgi:hypothetical protein
MRSAKFATSVCMSNAVFITSDLLLMCGLLTYPALIRLTLAPRGTSKLSEPWRGLARGAHQSRLCAHYGKHGDLETADSDATQQDARYLLTAGLLHPSNTPENQ